MVYGRDALLDRTTIYIYKIYNTPPRVALSVPRAQCFAGPRIPTVLLLLLSLYVFIVARPTYRGPSGRGVCRTYEKNVQQ